MHNKCRFDFHDGRYGLSQYVALIVGLLLLAVDCDRYAILHSDWLSSSCVPMTTPGRFVIELLRRLYPQCHVPDILYRQVLRWAYQIMEIYYP